MVSRVLNDMPTAMERIQVLCSPEVFAEVRTLAKHNRWSMSAMTSELIAHALKTPTYKNQLEEAAIKVPPKPDPRIAQQQKQFKADLIAGAVEGADLNEAKIQKLMMLMEILDKD